MGIKKSAKQQKAAAAAAVRRPARPARQARRERVTAQSAGPRVARAPNVKSTLSMMQNKLDGATQGIGEYMIGLTTPSTPCRPPITLGEFELDTDTYSYVFNGVGACTAAGFGSLTVCQDAWIESGNDGGPVTQYCSVNGFGTPVFVTPAGGAATTSTPFNSPTNANYQGQAMPRLDPGISANSRYRLTAVIMSVWPDSPAQTTQGDICIAVAQSEEALTNQVLNSATFTTLSGQPQEYVRHVERPLANWSSDDTGNVCAVPFNENCFVMQYVPASGNTNCGAVLMAAVIQGAAAGQSFRYKVELKYEVTAYATFQTSKQSIVSQRVPAPTEAVVPHLNALRPYSAHYAPRKHLPGVAAAAMNDTSPGLGTKVLSFLASSGVGSVIKSAAVQGLKSVPFVGSMLSSLVAAF